MNSEELKEFYPKMERFSDKFEMFSSCSSLPLLDLTPYKEKIRGIIF